MRASPRRLVEWRLRIAMGILRGRGRVKRGAALLAGALFASGLFFVAHGLFAELAAHETGVTFLPVAVTLALHVTFLFSLLRDTSGAMGHLFLAPDGAFLLAGPLGPRRILGIKAVEALSDAMVTPLGTSLPVLLAYGAAIGAGVGYFAAATIVLPLLLLLTVQLGFLLALVLAPWISPRRLRHVLGILGTGVFLLCWLALFWISRGLDTQQVEGVASPANWIRAREAAWFLPSSWASRSLVDLSQGIAGAWSGIVALVAATGLAGVLLWWLGPRYPDIWQQTQVRFRKRRDAPTPVVGGARPAPAPARLRHPPTLRDLVGAFRRRDSRLFLREPGMVADMSVLVIMTALLPVLLSPSIESSPAILAAIALGAVALVAVELGYEIGSRLFPLERRALLWAMSAPCASGSLLVARGLVAWMLSLPAIALIAAIGGAILARDARLFAQALALGAVLSALAVPVGMAAGVYLGRSDWRHPRQMLTLGGRLLLVGLLGGIAAGVWFALSRIDSTQSTAATVVVGWGGVWGWGLAGGAVVSLAAAWAAWWKWRRLEWLY